MNDNDIVAKKVAELKKQYSNKQTPLKFSFRKFVSANLHIKRSDVFTHNIHSYPGRLFPYIPIFFLSSDKFCPSNGKVLDIFSGSGTVLLESIVNPYFKNIRSEISKMPKIYILDLGIKSYLEKEKELTYAASSE